MFDFKEHTEPEKGFGKIWDEMIRPGLEDYAITYKKVYRQYIGGILAATFLFFGYVGYLLATTDAKELDTTQSVILIAVLLSAMALVYVGYAGYENLKKNTGLHFKQAIDRHFQELMSEDTETEPYLEVIKTLQEEDLLPTNTRLYDGASPYKGTHRGCDFSFFVTESFDVSRNHSVRENSIHNMTREETVNRHTYLVLQLKLKEPSPGYIKIETDYGRILNFIRSWWFERDMVRFDDPVFEKRFEVTADDEAQARKLVDKALRENLVGLQNYFGKTGLYFPEPKTPFFQTTRKVFATIQGDWLTIGIYGLKDVTGTEMIFTSPDKIVEAARTSISRVSQIPFIIDNFKDNDDILA